MDDSNCVQIYSKDKSTNKGNQYDVEKIRKLESQIRDGKN